MANAGIRIGVDAEHQRPDSNWPLGSAVKCPDPEPIPVRCQHGATPISKIAEGKAGLGSTFSDDHPALTDLQGELHVRRRPA